MEQTNILEVEVIDAFNIIQSSGYKRDVKLSAGLWWGRLYGRPSEKFPRESGKSDCLTCLITEARHRQVTQEALIGHCKLVSHAIKMELQSITVNKEDIRLIYHTPPNYPLNRAVQYEVANYHLSSAVGHSRNNKRSKNCAWSTSMINEPILPVPVPVKLHWNRFKFYTYIISNVYMMSNVQWQ